jgi:hypothetical protein
MPFKLALIEASSLHSRTAAYSKLSNGSNLPPGIHHPQFFVSLIVKNFESAVFFTITKDRPANLF